MNLVVLAAVIAACGAAKLDRTYLPPTSAKTAGGSPGSLQTPFARISQNNGLGGFPKGSFENDAEGVVVDAAAPGTRTSEVESGLGAPRISYGSTNSKVGAAAFKTRPSAFASPQSDEQGAQGSFQGGQGSFPTQGSFPGSQTSFPGSQGSFQGSQGSNAFQQGSGQQPERERASLDRTASILRYENENNGDNYHYSFETDNGISAEENGVATDGTRAQGGFSYTGDDGQVYSVSYTADEGGYQPKGDHLPTPPPIPVEILKSLEQNARDEAAGLVDDGSYDAQRYNAGSDYAESGDANGKYTHQSSNFEGPKADAGSFDQNQPSRRPNAQGSKFNGQNLNKQNRVGASGALDRFTSQSGQSSNRFGGQFGQNTESLDVDSDSAKPEQLGISSQNQPNRFGAFTGASTQGSSNRGQARPGSNRNEYLPPVNRPNSGRPQNGRPQNNRPQSGRPQAFTDISNPQSIQESSVDDEAPTAIPLGQQDLQDESRPQQALTSFGKPISNGLPSRNELTSSNIQNRPTNGRRPSQNRNNFAQEQSSQAGQSNEYLPPRKGSQNRRPSTRPQTNNNFAAQLNSQPNAGVDTSDDSQTQSFPTVSSTGSQSLFGNQAQQLNSFQRPQSSKPIQNGNRFSSQKQSSFNSASAPSAFGFSSQKATVQPATELTTPFESNDDESSSLTDSQTTSGNFAAPSQQTNSRPTQASFSNQYNQGFASQSVGRPQRPRPFGQPQPSAFPTQSSVEQFDSNSQFVKQPLMQNSFGQNDDAQFSSSTQRPSFTGQPQGPDDSYYYNQPSIPFGSSQGSQFPSSSSNQFDRVTQQSAFGQNQLNNVPSTAFPSNQFVGSTKQPRPPTFAPTSPTAEIQGQFGNNYRQPISNRQPGSPTVAPAVSSTSAQSQYQSNSINGVTQASISPFPSASPTSQGQFGSRPTFQQSQYNQASQSTGSSFAQQPTKPSFGQQPTASAPFSQRPSGSSSFPSRGQGFIQPENESGNEENEQPVKSQQYTGEIYEYSKPAVTLPPPDSTPVAPSGQFGQKMPGQFSQSASEEDQSPVSQFSGQSAAQGPRPQFGVQSKPQFSQNKFEAQEDDSNKPFGALAQSQAMFGAQFGQSRPQFGQSTPSESAQPESNIELSSDDEAESHSAEGPKNQFGFVSACCGNNASRKPGQSPFAQPSFAGAQKQPNGFIGQAEQFGGPRQPPSFDEETGYHY